MPNRPGQAGPDNTGKKYKKHDRSIPVRKVPKVPSKRDRAFLVFGDRFEETKFMNGKFQIKCVKTGRVFNLEKAPHMHKWWADEIKEPVKLPNSIFFEGRKQQTPCVTWSSKQKLYEVIVRYIDDTTPRPKRPLFRPHTPHQPPREFEPIPMTIVYNGTNEKRQDQIVYKTEDGRLFYMVKGTHSGWYIFEKTGPNKQKICIDMESQEAAFRELQVYLDSERDPTLGDDGKPLPMLFLNWRIRPETGDWHITVYEDPDGKTKMWLDTVETAESGPVTVKTAHRSLVQRGFSVRIQGRMPELEKELAKQNALQENAQPDK